MSTAAFRQPQAQPAFLMRLQHVNVAQIAEGGVIGDQPGETDLSGAVIQAEAQAVGEGLANGLFINALRP